MNTIDKITPPVIILIIVIAIIIFFYDEKITFNKTQTHYDSKLDIGTWVISYNFKTTSFTAKNDIELTITARPTDVYSEKFPEQLQNVKKIFVHLNNAYSGEPTYDTGGILLSEVMELELNDEKTMFEKTKTIQFDSGGEKCVIITENQQLESSIRMCKDIDILIEIDPAKKSFELGFNKGILTLTLVFVIGIWLQFRNWIVQVYHQESLGNNDGIKYDNPTRNNPMKRKGKVK